MKRKEIKQDNNERIVIKKFNKYNKKEASDPMLNQPNIFLF